VHAEGIAVAHGAKAGRDGAVMPSRTVFTLPTGNSNPLASWIACGMATEEGAEVPLDRSRRRRVAERTGEQRQ